MQQTQDAIYIISDTPQRAEALKQVIDLRGVDEIICLAPDKAGLLLKANPPAVAIFDWQGESRALLDLLTQTPASVHSLVIRQGFDEELFLACHDRGARDFMARPSDAYLVSRVLNALQERRQTQLARQKDRFLVELGVLSARSGALSTPYFLKVLKEAAEELSASSPQTLSLVLVQLGGYPQPLADAWQDALYQEVAGIIQSCARGFDVTGEYFMDKFAVLLPTDLQGARSLSRRLAEKLDGLAFTGPEGPLTLRVGMGVAEYTGCRHYEDLLNRALADLRQPQAKPGGPV